ncbi:MAG: redox-regulated ATPase YchF [Armatimonadetes bacterium]|nr:redox-regulated ATPase YchF [Armatimonadota bacterium]MDW8122127.1 redox-regulated ATPase YchF [Armatimonadota bacterium]
MLSIGIVGLPNVGKSTLFNALTRGHAAVSNYPFCTIDPNEGIVAIPDPRPYELARLVGQERVAPATVRFVDIAGLVRNAHKGEGLGNQFLSHIRSVDAIVHLVRCFADPNVGHIETTVDPVRDAEVVELELIMADWELVERRHSRVGKMAMSGVADAKEEAAVLEKMLTHLRGGRSLRTLPLSSKERDLVKGYQLLTLKPVIIVGNVDDSDESRQAFRQLDEWSRTHRYPCLPINAKLAYEFSLLSEEEAKELAPLFGDEAEALSRLIRTAFYTLKAIQFFTAVGKEVTSWVVDEGTPIVKAAGRIHSDMEEGFIRAEVVSFEDLKKAGSWEKARQEHLVFIRGKDYIVQDGDVVIIRFAPSRRAGS